LAYAIALSGNDVYIAGTTFGHNNINGSNAVFWKNGVQVSLTPDSIGSTGASIAVYGNNIYVAGTKFYKHEDVATYWRNGQAILLDTVGPFSADGVATWQ
jgi:hypothetical protein